MRDINEEDEEYVERCSIVGARERRRWGEREIKQEDKGEDGKVENEESGAGVGRIKCEHIDEEENTTKK